jgi:adenosylcobalamin-dependent ribonucleoside-triphosphate reductase
MPSSSPAMSTWMPNQEYVYISRYSRWQETIKRRETYPETTDRYLDFMQESLGDVVTPHFRRIGREAILGMDVMPSMRTLWAAGDAARANNITMYNCSFLVMNEIKAFSEVLFILMCGTGVGFSVEREFVDQLPQLKPGSGKTVKIVVEDSKDGWASSFDKVLTALWEGHDIETDVSKVRKRGERLKMMGGRASGPEPLVKLFLFCQTMFREKRRKGIWRLESIDVHDINNMTAEIVVVGGVRRSSEISLSDLDDRRMAEAKMGAFWDTHPYRSMANNSAVYKQKPDVTTYAEEFLNLIKSGTGERGIFNREGAYKQMVSSGRRKATIDGKTFHIIGTNPCGEIILRDMEFCNLSEVVVRADDNLESLRQKVKVASMFGAWQATFTEFPYLRPQWKVNCDEERLLGVSLTGVMDNPILNHVNDKMKRWLGDLKGVAISETEKWCKRLDINMSAAITCGKPSGTVSQLVNCSSGTSHARHSSHYIRRYRNSSNDPVFHLMRDAGVPWHPEVSEDDPNNPKTVVLEFPVAAPPQSLTRHDINALQQLEHWKTMKEFWCEHNPSVTVYVDFNEWFDVQAWCHRNFDDLCGVSFLPKDTGLYQLAPYEDITKSQYDELLAKFPKIDYSKLPEYEKEDNTQGSQSYACTGGSCEIA